MAYKFKVLSIDGGGIRGIVPAKILAEIEKRTGQLEGRPEGRRISSLFNLIAGTSTGGILAAGLTKPNPNNTKQPAYTAEKLIDIYRERGAEIFYEPLLERLSRTDDLIRPKYASDGRQKVLEEYFGDTPLKDALTEIFITSYDIELRTPVFFTSNEEPEKEVKGSRYFRKICNGFTMLQATMATSAAPTYFEPHVVPTIHNENRRYTLVDGGVFANNPTSLALMEAIINSKKGYKKSGQEPLSLDDILVVSLGTGSLTRRFSYERAKNWGLLGWVEPLLNITLDGSSESVAVQLEQLLPNALDRPPQYYRFQSFLDAGKGEDDIDITTAENIKNLEALADKIIEDRSKDLDELCKQLLE